MSSVFGTYGPRHPRLAAAAGELARRVTRRRFAKRSFHVPGGAFEQERLADLRRRLAAGETAYLLGIGPAGHNSGVSLVEASPAGVRMICNEEEERYSAVKHSTEYPQLSIEALRRRMADMGLTGRDVHTCLATWDYVGVTGLMFQALFEEAPDTLRPHEVPVEFNIQHVFAAPEAPEKLGRAFGLDGPMPVLGVTHHDSHASFSYAASPFARTPGRTAIAVVDGFGDRGSVSLYSAEGGDIELLYENGNAYDSLGVMYALLSSTQGGWPVLSSEGRYMGAAAWGDGSRLTNPYYRRLRQLFWFGRDGEVRLNRSLANWHRRHLADPYTEELTDILGPPIPTDQLWDPDAVLRVEPDGPADDTTERVDKAAATQMLFEDALFHIVDNLVRTTRATQLVMTGGTALNCVANMRLLDHFDEDWYDRYLGMPGQRLELWVPPVPGDAGAPPGAAFSFALRAGALPGEPLRHAFYCGAAPSAEEVGGAIEADADVESRRVGNVNEEDGLETVADLMAHLVSSDAVIGLYQGPAETGPRALGHRSILANPCNPDTLEMLNARVKFRERIRPLAPMATLEAAKRFFELSPGVAADDYNGYNYMVLTAPARPEAHTAIPAVVHRDGTGRVQIVRKETDPLSHAFLEAMGRHAGVEVSVNTSLNVAAPICQTPEQAIETLKRSRGMDGLVMVDADGEASLVWLASRPDARDRLFSRLDAWAAA